MSPNTFETVIIDKQSISSEPPVVINISDDNFNDVINNNNSNETNCDKYNTEKFVPTSEVSWLFDDALKLIGFGYVQYAAIIICGLILMSVIIETMGIMMIITPAQCDLDLTSMHKGMLNAAAFLGVTCPSYLWGYLSDTKGRRHVMLPTLLMSCLFSACSAFAPNFTSFIVLRFCVGVFISASSASVYAYLGEFNRLKSRPSIIAWSSLSVGLGVTFIPLVASWILSYNFRVDLWGVLEFRPWRLLVLVYTAVGLIAAFLLYKFPESPRYYLVQGREEDALEILKWIYRKNTGESDEFYPVRKLISESVVPTSPVPVIKEKVGVSSVLRSMLEQTKPLFKTPLLVHFLSSCILMFSVFFVSGGFGMWFAELTNRVSSSSPSTDTSGTICELLRSTKMSIRVTANETVTCNDTMADRVFIQSTTVGVYTLIGLFLICILMKPLGRGLIQVICFLMFGCSGFALIWATDSSLVMSLFITLLVPASASVSVISGGAVVLFPTHVRAMAVCIVLMCGRIGSVVGSNAVGYLIENNCELAFGINGVVGIVAFIINFSLPFR